MQPAFSTPSLHQGNGEICRLTVEHFEVVLVAAFGNLMLCHCIQNRASWFIHVSAIAKMALRGKIANFTKSGTNRPAFASGQQGFETPYARGVNQMSMVR